MQLFQKFQVKCDCRFKESMIQSMTYNDRLNLSSLSSPNIDYVLLRNELQAIQSYRIDIDAYEILHFINIQIAFTNYPYEMHI